jgi:beta-hydroxylase
MLDRPEPAAPAPKKKKPLSRRLKAAANKPGKWASVALQRWIAKGSAVPDRELIDKTEFPWIAELEANADVIRRELLAVIGDRDRMPTMQDISKTQRKIIKDTSWKTFFLYAYGLKAEANRVRCPETTKLIDKIPNLEVAFFSILDPGAHIRAHHGVYKGLLRVHLGLLVPEPREKCRMQVGGETILWQEGEAVMFDDTYLHEVWNETDGVRAILLIDVHRPLKPPQGAVNRALLKVARRAPFVAESAAAYRKWEREYYGRNA